MKPYLPGRPLSLYRPVLPLVFSNPNTEESEEPVPSTDSVPLQVLSMRRPLSGFRPLLPGAGPITAAAPQTWSIAGKITENCTPVARIVRLYKRSDGNLVSTTISNAGDGSYSFTVADGTTLYYVVAIDDDAGISYNAVIADKVHGE